MVRIEDTLWCDGCGVEITWVPVYDQHRQYCCQKCQEGEECDCASRQEMEDDRLANPTFPPLGLTL